MQGGESHKNRYIGPGDQLKRKWKADTGVEEGEVVSVRTVNPRQQSRDPRRRESQAPTYSDLRQRELQRRTGERKKVS